MHTRRLGSNGPEVSAFALGCMNITGFYGPVSKAEALRVLDTARDLGVTFFDTANIYGMGLSEDILGEWLRTHSAPVVLASKAAIRPGPPREFDNSAAHLRQELETSLRRLGRDHLDLYYLHRRDPRIPVEEAVGTLGRFIEEGKIRAYGLSEVAPATLRRAHAVLPCAAVQNEYSLWTRQAELGLMQTCAELGVSFLPFCPLGRGVFTDQHPDPENFAPNDFRRTSPRFLEPALSYNERYAKAFRAYAQTQDVPAASLALAWVLDRGAQVIPVPGTSKPAHLAQLALGADLRLTPQQRLEIERILPIGYAEGDRYSDAQALGAERYC